MSISSTKTYDVVILTDSRFTNQEIEDSFYQNVYLEDGLLKKSLENIGLKTIILAWDNLKFDWKDTKYVIFRSTWDYFDRFEEFSNWLKKVSQKTILLNSAKIIRWNIDKHYLLDLSTKGIHTIPTQYIDKGSKNTLKNLLDQNNWKEAILKPCISAGAYRTFRVNLNNYEELESKFQQIIKEQDMMLQPFQQNIVKKGEISLVVINGQFTHAVLKKAKSGDYRVQDDYGGSVHPYTPTVAEIAFAEKTIAACLEKPIYARVDLVTDNDGKTALIELELIEPELWFRNNANAANSLAKAIKSLA